MNLKLHFKLMIGTEVIQERDNFKVWVPLVLISVNERNFQLYEPLISHRHRRRISLILKLIYKKWREYMFLFDLWQKQETWTRVSIERIHCRNR